MGGRLEGEYSPGYADLGGHQQRIPANICPHVYGDVPGLQQAANYVAFTRFVLAEHDDRSMHEVP